MGRILTHDNRGYAPEPGGSRQNFPLCDEVRRLFQCAGTGLTTSAGQLRTLIGSHEGLARFSDGTQQDMEGVLIALLNLIDEEIKRGGVKSPFLDIFSGKTIDAHNFSETEDGSCPLCGSEATTTEQNFTIMMLTVDKSGQRRRIMDLINSNFDIDNKSRQFRKRCEKCQSSSIPEKSYLPAHTTKIISMLPREVLMGVGDGVASVIMLTLTKRPGPHADFYSEARPPC